MLEAVNHAARALGSSLDQHEAFAAFSRELRSDRLRQPPDRAPREQVAGAVENIRAYEAERSAAEELRRLSALRADFVSMVSHELRAPMASVIGCTQTLNHRWRELTQGERESFLGLIESETSRLSDLVGDVLDTAWASSSPARSPRRTGARSTSSPTPAPARRSRCACPWRA